MIKGESLCDDLRINSHLLDLVNYDVEIHYLSDKSDYIILADHLSRKESLSKKCEGQCRVCEAADAPILNSSALEFEKDKEKKDRFHLISEMEAFRSVEFF